MVPVSRQPRLRRAPCIASLSLLLVAICPPARAQKPPPPSTAPPDSLARMNEAIDALTRKVWPSVVQILVTSYGPREEGARGETSLVVGRQRSVGSGFVIDADGYIMTNAHVVSGAQRVQVVLPSDNADGTLATALSGRTYLVAARIAGIATELDLALLKIDGVKLMATGSDTSKVIASLKKTDELVITGVAKDGYIKVLGSMGEGFVKTALIAK